MNEIEKIIAAAEKYTEAKRSLNRAKKRFSLAEKELKSLVGQTDSKSVIVILKGKHLLLDLENLKDEEYAMRDRDGQYDFPCGHYFNADNAVKAAEKAGKRLLTHEEMKEIATLPNRWDDERKGRWFTFQTPTGNAVEVFFEACGYISAATGGLTYVGSNGYYWSASPNSSSSSYASSLGFASSGSFDVRNSYPRSYGFSVRCVREL